LSYEDARDRRFDRYYDPSTDQFLSVDPDLAATGQPYALTDDDPLNKTDPLGLQGSAGIAAAVAYQNKVNAFAAYCKRTHNRGTKASVSGGHCGEHWYQSESLSVAGDVASGVVCASGVGTAVCVAGLAVAGALHVTQDKLNKCGSGRIIYDSASGVASAATGGFTRLAGSALEHAPLFGKIIFGITTNVQNAPDPVACK
jgi:hypothetical protein